VSLEAVLVPNETSLEHRACYSTADLLTSRDFVRFVRLAGSLQVNVGITSADAVQVMPVYNLVASTVNVDASTFLRHVLRPSQPAASHPKSKKL
jgi:hypothetical protein